MPPPFLRQKGCFRRAQWLRSGSVSTLCATSDDHDVMHDRPQDHLTLTRTFTARAQGVAEVAFEHAHDRLGLRTLSVGLTCLRPGQLPPHAPAVTASRRLATGPADAGLDQRYRPLR